MSDKVGLGWMERSLKGMERLLEARRRRLQKRKTSELRLIPAGEEEKSYPKRRRGWKVVEMSKTNLENLRTQQKSAAKETRFSGKWDRRTAKWDRRARKHRW